MTSASAVVTSNSVPAVRVANASLHWQLIPQLALCVVPALASVGLGHLLLGARYIMASLTLFLVYHFVRGHKYEYMALTVAALPALAFFRGAFFYYSIIVFLAGGLLLWFAVSPQEVRFVSSDPVWKWLVASLLVYWWASVLNTGQPFANIRNLDCILGLTAVYLLVNRRSWLATAFVGLGLSASVLALALLPYGDRLGAADIDSIHVGNPILMGVPSAMVLLLTVADNGRWLRLEKYPVGRGILALLCGQWLVLSGSRGSWAIVTVGFILLLLFSKFGRKAFVGVLVVASLASMLVLLSNRGTKIQGVFEKTVDSDRSWKTRTSFRSVQWAAMPYVFSMSPLWGWGPGTGKDVAYLYTGRHLNWHSVYLQVLGETGLLGFLVLAWILGSLIRRSAAHLRRWGEIMPLLGVAAFMTLGMSVAGFDSFSGIFLGLAIITRERFPRLASQNVQIRPAPVPSAMPFSAATLLHR